MKTKIAIYFIFSIFLLGCSSQGEDFTQNQCKVSDLESFLVTEKQAVNEAVAFFQAQGDNSYRKSRARIKRKALAQPSVKTTIYQEGVYIVNFEDNAGFAVVSADKRDGVSVYLASSEGNFDENSLQNKELLAAVGAYQNAMVSTQKFNPDKGDGTATETAIVKESYGPLLKTCWHQGYPFNQELSNLYGVSAPIGCVPVAIGQIINYYKYPNRIDGENIDWNLISLATGKEDASNQATNAASRLLYMLGKGLGIEYPKESGASFDDAKKEFRELGYTFSTKSGFDESLVKGQVASGNPIYMRGQNSVSGHAWVVDGFMAVKTEYRLYDDEGNLVPNTVLNDYNYDTYSEYFLLNLGWGQNGLYEKSIRYEYSCDAYHRVWTYSKIFDFSSYSNPNHDYNDKIMLIYNFSHK